MDSYFPSSDMPLWKPDEKTAQSSAMAKFIEFINQRYQLNFSHYQQLHDWSIHSINEFWLAVWDFCEIIGKQKSKIAYIKQPQMIDCEWFPTSSLNFAKNLLKYQDDHLALIYIDENFISQNFTYVQLHYHVNQCIYFLIQAGVQSGDRVAGWLSNRPETVIAMLATTAIGAIWTACSPEFAAQAVLDRFKQIKPKILFTQINHQYGGKLFDHSLQIKYLQENLDSLVMTVVIDKNNSFTNINKLHTFTWSSIIENKLNEIFEFHEFSFNHPVYILYSSGTTGKPKCIVHRGGGVLLQHLKELILHTNLQRSDTIFFYTSASWMMWHWMISSLAVGATIVLYDGSPIYPNSTKLLDLIDPFNISIFGIGAQIIEHIQKTAQIPQQTHRFDSLQTILTTGSPLLPNNFDFVYNAIKKDVRLSSISGGSDLISCFALGNPMLPVYRGELQCLGLGMDVQIFNENGQSVIEEKGELICANAFPSMPVYFWNDLDGQQYHDAYFSKYPNVWTHGDYAKITKHHGLVIYGRSDAVLNPGGIRIGTAEIYQVLESFFEIQESLAIMHRHHNQDEIILFIILKPHLELTTELENKIKKTVRNQTSPHHVPDHIFAVPDFPRTLNNKLAEIAVKKTIQGEAIDNLNALANPDALEYFKNLKWD